MSRHQITQTDFDWGESLLLRGMEDRLLTHFSFMTGDPYEWSRLLRKVYRPYRQLGPGFGARRESSANPSEWLFDLLPWDAGWKRSGEAKTRNRRT